MKALKPWLYALAAALLAVLLIFTGAFRRVDRWMQDGLFQRPRVTSTDILIIGIDEDTLDELGPFGPSYRTYVAMALEKMASDPEHLPAVTAVDILYTSPSGDPDADADLAMAAWRLKNVVTASVATYGEDIQWSEGRAVSLRTAITRYEEPYAGLKSVTTQGHINAMYDKDGVLRHALLYVDVEDRRVYSMAWEAARIWLEARGQTLREPPVGKTGFFYIPYAGAPGSYYEGVSLADVLYGRVSPEYWAGKIILIGPCAPALQDAYVTPINSALQMYGVEIQANIIQCLLEENYKTDAPEWIQYLALFLLCFGAMLLYQRLSLQRGGAVCAGLIGVSLLASVLIYLAGLVTHPLWIPLCALLLYIAALAVKYVRTARERRALALEKERIAAELSLATRIQASALPKTFPPFPDRHEFDIYASMNPAKEVGGDLYDFFLIDDDHLALVIGDVAGKGMPAALFMMVALALLRHIVLEEKSPGKALTKLNADICARNPEEMFVTMWLGVLEISTGRLTCANAGHEYPGLKKPGARFELVKDRHGLVIGGMEGVRYREYELQLEPGSKIFVYTDGVPEATDKSETLFGTDRMVEALQTRENEPPEQILAAVKDAVWAFVDTAPQFDDLTMLCLEYHGAAGAAAEAPSGSLPRG